MKRRSNMKRRKRTISEMAVLWECSMTTSTPNPRMMYVATNWLKECNLKLHFSRATLKITWRALAFQ